MDSPNYNHDNSSGQQPATPRMLRSLSGTLKNSKSDLEGMPAYQELARQPTRNRSASNRVVPPPTPAQMFHPQQPQQQQYHPEPLQRAELLPPASFSSQQAPVAPAPSPAAAATDERQKHHHHTEPSSHHHNENSSHHHHQQQQQQQQQQFHRKSIGDWDFIKTIGAGSMGKVKLAQHNSTREVCAVKIVPRAAKLYQRAHANDPPPVDSQEIAKKQKEFEKEIARDKRTIREGALGRLLFHPFVCRLYEMVPMTNHYYMLFEYVEGGQMLDYIVSHGSLKEKYARKFARGIASALDYCHKNNVVHRDLKIENIMINQKGDIKIIDFGLSNLYSPKSLLKTYCGSLYFAAPELLSAKPYIGPEVDVWSFGVVIYVLVCGKVPFDDQVVSVLHEKIKRGDVEYPEFLSKECVSLLSRMLVVDPQKRASLYEVIQHPWMNKGYEYAVSSYIPKRLPLTLPLDADIIKTIASFDLGSVQSIADELTNILSSVEYQMSTENWYKCTKQGRPYASASNSHILPDPTGGFHPLVSIYYLVDEMKKRKRVKEEAIRVQQEQQQQQRLRQQQQAQQAQQAQQTPSQTLIRQRPSVGSPAQPPSGSLVGPSGAFSGPKAPSSPLPVPAQLSTPTQPVNQAVPLSVTPQKPVPELSFPEQAHTSSSPATFARVSQSPPVLITETNTSQQKDQATIPEQQPQSPRDSNGSETLDPNAGKQLGLNSLLRRLSSKKQKNSPTSSGNKTSGYTSSPTTSDHRSSATSSPTKNFNHTDSPTSSEHKSSNYTTAGPDHTNTSVSPTASQYYVPPTAAAPPVPIVSVLADSKDRLTPQDSPSTRHSAKTDPLVRRGVSMKVTAKERSSATLQSQERENSTKKMASSTTGKHHSRSSSTSTSNNKFQGFVPVEYLPPLPNINPNNLVPPGQDVGFVEGKEGVVTTGGATGGISTGGRKLHPTARAKSVGGHVRKDSYSARKHSNSNQHPPLPNSLASQNSDERISNGSNNDGFFDDVSLDNIEHQDIPHLTEDEIIDQFNHARHNSMPSIEYPKTLFLKGFFSVQTTSTKPLPVIRYNIINVLSKLGVKFQEVKGGFVCAHAPSLQLPSPPQHTKHTSIASGNQAGASYNVSMNSSNGVVQEEFNDDEEENMRDKNYRQEEDLYGDAFRSTSSSFNAKDEISPPRVKTPEPTDSSQHSQTKSLTRQPSLHVNTVGFSPTPGSVSAKGEHRSSHSMSHRSSNSMGGGHRRRFSIGQSILNSYRKKNGSGVLMPPNTPATAKLQKLIYDGEEVDDEELEEHLKQQYAEDDSIDSLNGMMIGGGSDMLVSSRLEHKAKYQHSPNTSMSQDSAGTSRKSPLKFEIHIVKVPLVGLYGVQFKKVLGNTWNYKTLASQILNELNL